MAVDRNGRRFLGCEVGSRDTNTGRKLWDSIKNNDITDVMTDYWKPYGNFVPPDLHTQSKAETYTVKGYNSPFQHFLARLRRKSKCYSKRKDMLKYSVMLLMLKRNGNLDAILIKEYEIFQFPYPTLSRSSLARDKFLHSSHSKLTYKLTNVTSDGNFLPLRR